MDLGCSQAKCKHCLTLFAPLAGEYQVYIGEGRYITLPMSSSDNSQIIDDSLNSIRFAIVISRCDDGFYCR